ncbi:MAG TPA: RND transporter [Gammaproteobacteria bacterium]|nr:RND transporter [Gammaproteobacteria bacterium]
MNWLDRIPYSILVPLALFLTFAPFVPEPHLWQKLKMLADGALVKPIDIFDLFLHGTPLVLLLVKLARRGSAS